MKIRPENIYHIQMTEAKYRILSAEKVLVAKTPVTGLSSLDLEFCFLQIRKTIELITFGAMIREEKRYRQYRMTESIKSDPTQDWRAKTILEKLVKLSPHMLPIPLGKLSRTGPDTVNFDPIVGTFNQTKLISIYDDCSSFMHAANPLVEDYVKHVEEWRLKYDTAGQVATEALAFLRMLLWRHAAVQLAWTDHQDASSADDPQDVWVLDFSHSEDGIVEMVLATARG